jgi:hypothetical protein
VTDVALGAVVLDVTPKAFRVALIVHNGGVLGCEIGGMRHWQAVAAVTERPLVTPRAVCALSLRYIRMAPNEVHGMRQRHSVTANAVVPRVAGGARLEVAHPVRALPVDAVGHRPLTRAQPISTILLRVADIAVGTDSLGVMALQALVHAERRQPRDSRAVRHIPMAFRACATVPALGMHDVQPVSSRDTLHDCHMTGQARGIRNRRCGAAVRGNDPERHAENQVVREGRTWHEAGGDVATRAREVGVGSCRCLLSEDRIVVTSGTPGQCRGCNGEHDCPKKDGCRHEPGSYADGACAPTGTQVVIHLVSGKVAYCCSVTLGHGSMTERA